MTLAKKSRNLLTACFAVAILFLSPLSSVAAQFARPASDVSAGSYTATPLWSSLDETTADDDTTEIVSANNVSESDGTGFEVQLSALSDPQSSTGHIFRFRAEKQTGGRTVDVSCRLYQGATAISPTRTLASLGTTYTTDTYALSSAEADAITDYTNLRVRCWTAISGGGPATSSALTWIELEVPDAPAGQSKPFLLVVSE